jgi:hypothetical protein
MDLTPNKFCRPGLATGANNGLTFADAWQSFTDMDNGVSAGDTVGIPYGTYTGETMPLTKAGTAYNNRIIITACDTDGSALIASDIIVDGKKVFIDGESSLTYCASANGATFVTLAGIEFVNAVSHGLDFDTSITYAFQLYLCGGNSCGGNIIQAVTYTRGLLVYGGNYRNAGNRGLNVDDGAKAFFVKVENCPNGGFIGAQKHVVRGCIFVNCGQSTTHHAIHDPSGGSSYFGNVFYNCAQGIRANGDYHTISHNRFVNTTNECVRLDVSADIGIVILGNAYYNNGSKYSINASAEIGVLCDEIDMSGHGMINPAGGNYMSDPATDDSGNVEHNIDSINSAYTTAGLPPEIGSGGGTQYHFRPGQARGPVTH